MMFDEQRVIRTRQNGRTMLSSVTHTNVFNRVVKSDARLGGYPHYILANLGEQFVRIPEQIRDCCCFIYCDTTKGRKLVGTGFFLAEEYARDTAETLQCMYLVTAKHIIAGIKSRKPTPTMGMRVNVSGEETIDIDIPIDKWLFHPTDMSIDAAITSIDASVVDDRRLDIRPVPTYIAVTDERIGEIAIGIGDDICVTGLFYKHYGTKRNLPILRMGTIAMMPEEPIQTKHFGLMQAYLIELRSIGGLSGSPVFIPISVYPEAFNYGLFWLGLMQGHWETDKESIDILDVSDAQQLNVGIGIVVPATKILEITQREDLMAAKKQAKEKFLKRNLPKEDMIGISEGEFHKILDKASQPIVEKKDESKSDSGKSGT